MPSDCPYDYPGCYHLNDGEAGSCGGCLTDADCPSGLSCDPRYGYCTCSTSGCGGDAPNCVQNAQLDAGFCGCTSDADCGSGHCDQTNFYFGACVPDCLATPCTSSAPGLVCDSDAGSPTAGLCLQCLSDPDCVSAGLGSFCVSDFCTNCRTNADCQALDAGTPLCNFSCVQCIQPSDCPNGDGCNSYTGTCGSCTWTQDCPAGDACTSDGRCEVVCSAGGQLTNCAPCNFDADCPPDAGSCSPAGICGGPSDGGIPGACGTGYCSQGQVCDTSTNTCVDCLVDADCSNTSAPLCDPASHACVQCLSPADCPLEFPGCSAGVCGRCASNQDCGTSGLTCGADQMCHCGDASSCGPDAPACVFDGDAGFCGCQSSADCQPGTICDQVSFPYGGCLLPCVVDGGGCDWNPNAPDCDNRPDSGTYGVCVPCLSDAECQGASAGQYCTAYGCADCRGDSDCAGVFTDAGATPYCEGICVQCRSYTDCAGTSGCNSLYGTCGSCAFDSDCPPSAPTCTNNVCG